jgi:hypothetical protein
MRATTVTGVLLLLAVGVGRGDPPSAPAVPASPALAPPPPISPLPALPPATLNWSKSERIDTPAPPPKPVTPATTVTPAKPDPKTLKGENDKLDAEHAEVKPGKAEPAEDKDALNQKLNDLLKKLAEQKNAPKPATPATKPHDPHDPHPPTPPKVILPEGGKPADQVRSAGNLFQAKDLDEAYRIVKGLDLSQLTKEDRAFAEYIRAACLRKQGKLQDALTVYRQIADAKEDPFLADCAVTQITAINSARELEAQLEQLKSRRKPK